MHELSIVMSIVDIATKQTKQAEAKEVEQIELVIGELSGIEMNSFEFAWKQGIRDTVLQKAELLITRPNGLGQCIDCETVFPMHQLFDACTNCGSHLVGIKQGKEMKVKALVVK